MKKLLQILALSVLTVSGLTLVGCKEKDPAEKVADAIEDTADKAADATKDAAEKTADAVKDATK